ncbi:MAG: Y-family DNA polymerase [Lactobacillales bacterium]|jgi:DNA polymerase V|nr:Y-family DNA polymerase [Lactobacillales bacterium]
MYGLIDCNNFFVSCERVFNPALNGKSVVVLSNNDGCVVARSNEAKAMGIKMGTPAFRLRELVAAQKVRMLSSNYVLYGDMSGRVMSLLAAAVPDLEIYSIDEAFVKLDGIPDLPVYAKNLADTISKGTGIPISLGVAPTKTLAKIAGRFAKKYPRYEQVCLMDTDEKRIKALQLTRIEDVWGIGRKLSAKLKREGIETAYDFTLRSAGWARKTMTVMGERLWRELHGWPCVDMQQDDGDKKQICTSRSFEKMISDKNILAQAIATHAGACAYKLRLQHACAGAIIVFMYTNRHRADLPQCVRNGYIKLHTPSADTRDVTAAALKALDTIFLKGFQYKKAGVIATDIIPQNRVERDLFDIGNTDRATYLMHTLDQINDTFPENKMRFAICGDGTAWKNKRTLLTPSYTTKLTDIIKIKSA